MYAPTSTNSPRSGPNSGEDDALTDFDGAGEILRAWGSLGYPRRALRLKECAQVIVREYGGEVPEDVDKLHALAQRRGTVRGSVPVEVGVDTDDAHA